jgi:hypothetical protein
MYIHSSLFLSKGNKKKTVSIFFSIQEALTISLRNAKVFTLSNMSLSRASSISHLSSSVSRLSVTVERSKNKKNEKSNERGNKLMMLHTGHIYIYL